MSCQFDEVFYDYIKYADLLFYQVQFHHPCLPFIVGHILLRLAIPIRLRDILPIAKLVQYSQSLVS